MRESLATEHISAAEHVNGWEMVILPESHGPRPTPVAERAGVNAHRWVSDRYRYLELQAPRIAERARPGQFVMITLARPGEPTPALPRPMAIYRTDRRRGTIEILFGVVGAGTTKLSHIHIDDELLVVGPLGREFDITPTTTSVLLVGRGIGSCSLTTVAQHNHASGIATIAVASGRRPDTIVGADLYRRYGARLYQVDDVSGTSSPDALFATLTADLDDDPPQQIFTCGSERLTRLCEQLSARWSAPVQISVEAHMACGLGYCHGCASGARSHGDESPLICKDGPVFQWLPQAAGAK